MKFVKKAVARSCHCKVCLGYGKTWNLSVIGNNWQFLVEDAISDLHFKKISPTAVWLTNGSSRQGQKQRNQLGSCFISPERR